MVFRSCDRLLRNLIIRANRDTHCGSFGSREITLVAILPFVSLVAWHYLEVSYVTWQALERVDEMNSVSSWCKTTYNVLRMSTICKTTCTVLRVSLDVITNETITHLSQFLNLYPCNFLNLSFL